MKRSNAPPTKIPNNPSFELEEEEFEEALGLLDQTKTSLDYEKNPEQENNSTKAWRWWIVTIFLVTVWSMFLFKDSKDDNDPAHFQCPAEQLGLPENMQEFEETFIASYENVSTKINMTEEFSSTFRNITFDNWGFTYSEVKANIQDWKVKHYLPYMKNGNSMYESACGIGLNLYMTLEILQELGGIEDIVVYGNEYVDVSTQKANELFDLIPPAGAKKGQICTGDSTDLSYIPEASFDLVSTGYLR
jgi:hypothetical protein